ncbi:MAG: prolipoprotein diacylglyceryl transferase [Clostridia bacterium]|nr:prolipoprotein diacylglyceryl transferase [Clostridia bacterium]
MENVAYYFGSATIYRSGMLVALGVLVAALCMIFLWKSIGGKLYSVNCFLVLSLMLGTLGSRLVYWYCCYEQYDSIFSAIFSVGHGGFSIFGAMIGVLLSALILCAMRIVNDMTRLFDCIAPSGALAIAIGRLAGFFTADDKAKTFNEGALPQGFPFSVKVINEVTGTSEWRFPTFFYESLAAAAIFMMCIFLFNAVYFKRTIRKGVVFWIFLSFYGATQAVLESTRYDALFLHSNGFLSLMQMACAAMLLVSIVVVGIKGLRSLDRKNPTFLFISTLALMGAAGYLEYYVQRHGSLSVSIYPIMFACLLAVSIITFIYTMQTQKGIRDDY